MFVVDPFIFLIIIRLEPTTRDISDKFDHFKCDGNEETVFAHKDIIETKPMNVTVWETQHRSNDYEIHVLAVLKDNGIYFQTPRMQCRDLGPGVSRRQLVRWSCLPIECNSKKAPCEDPEYDSAQKRAKECNKFRCCKTEDLDIPETWGTDQKWKESCNKIVCS